MDSSIKDISVQLKEVEIRKVALASALVMNANTDQPPATGFPIGLTVGDPLVWKVPGHDSTSEGVIQGFGTVGKGVSPSYHVLRTATMHAASHSELVPPAWILASGGGSCLSAEQIDEIEERMSHNVKLLGLLEREDLKGLAKSNGMNANDPHIVKSLASVLNIYWSYCCQIIWQGPTL